MSELERFGDLSLNLEQVYNTMDGLNDEVIERSCQPSYEMVKKIHTDPIEVIFYDTTTLYFESESSDSLREKGYSKDGKHHQVQLVFVLLTTPGGMPVGQKEGIKPSFFVPLSWVLLAILNIRAQCDVLRKQLLQVVDLAVELVIEPVDPVIEPVLESDKLAVDN